MPSVSSNVSAPTPRSSLRHVSQPTPRTSTAYSWCATRHRRGASPATCAGRVRRGGRMGVAVGPGRVGIAAGAPAGMLAPPVQTLRRDPRGGTDLDQIAALVNERAAVELVVGLPQSLPGRPGPAAHAVRNYAEQLAGRVAVPVRLGDERVSPRQGGARPPGARGAGPRERAEVAPAP